MMNWLSTLSFHTYAVREDGPPRSQTRSEFGKALVAIELDSQAAPNDNDDECGADDD